MKQRSIYLFFLVALTGLLSSCQFFETDPDNVLKEGDYIAKESEM